MVSECKYYQKAVKRFKARLNDQSDFDQLFEYLSDVYFFVKDEHYKLVMCNRASLSLFKLKEKSEILGKSEYDFFPQRLAAPIHEDDVRVMELMEPIINRMELIVNEEGMMVWVLTTKLPLSKKDGSVAGLMGTTRVLQHPDMIPDTFKRHAKALEHIKQYYNQTIRVQDLASMCQLSVSRFRETFRERFMMSPQKFLLKVRMQMACQKLVHSDQEIVEIAQACGFCDQSYFTRQFRKHTGLPPLQYRKRHRAERT